MMISSIARRLPLLVAMVVVAFIGMGQAYAQRGRLAIADYSVSASATQITIDGVPAPPQTNARELPRIQLAGSLAKQIQLTRTADNSVLASTMLAPDPDLDYLLLASGDGQTLPYKLQVEASVGVRTRLFNASRLLGEAPEFEVMMEGNGGEGAVHAAAGSLSASLAVNRNNLSLRLRRASDGSTLLHLQRFDYGRVGLARDVIVVLHGTQGALRADEIGISDSIAYVETPLLALALGSVQVKLLNGGAFFGGPAPLDMTVAGQSARVEYGEFSTALTLPEQGVYDVCAEASHGATQIPQIACGSLEFEGGQSYVAISRSYSVSELVAGGPGVDPIPFLAYPETEVAGSVSRVRVFYGAVAPRFGELLYVAADVGGEPQVIASPRSAQPSPNSGSVTTVLDGAPARTDIKVSADYGTRNLADLAPFTPASGEAVDVFVIGDGQLFPYRLVSSRGLEEELVVDERTSGFWTIDEFPLEGFNLTPMPEQDRMLGTWFNHTADDRPQWFVMDSCASNPGAGDCAAPVAFNSNTVALRVYRSDKLGTSRNLQDAGTMQIAFSDCTVAIATVELLGQASQTLHLSNQTPTAECKLAQLFPSGWR